MPSAITIFIVQHAFSYIRKLNDKTCPKRAKTAINDCRGVRLSFANFLRHKTKSLMQKNKMSDKINFGHTP